MYSCYFPSCNSLSSPFRFLSVSFYSSLSLSSSQFQLSFHFRFLSLSFISFSHFFHSFLRLSFLPFYLSLSLSCCINITLTLVYLLENTYPGERCTPAVQKANDLVQSFLGAPVLVDAADLGAAAHRVRLFWTNMMQPAILQAALPKLLLPSPPLSSILKPHHVPTKARQDRKSVV